MSIAEWFNNNPDIVLFFIILLFLLISLFTGVFVVTYHNPAKVDLEEEIKKVSECKPMKPNYYTKNGLSCLEVIKKSLGKEKYEGFLVGNILKYIWRYRDKNGIEDLKKAKQYLEWLTEEVESE